MTGYDEHNRSDSKARLNNEVAQEGGLGMKRRRSVLEVKILIDPVPGWGHKPEDHVKFLRDALESRIPHYRPEVVLLRVEDCG